jgi:hypothetical protein
MPELSYISQTPDVSSNRKSKLLGMKDGKQSECIKEIHLDRTMYLSEF